MPPILIDTNLLVYLYDRGSPGKAAWARQVLDRLELTRSGRISVQNLAEFFRVVTAKLDPPLNLDDAMAQVSLLTRLFPVFDLTAMIVWRLRGGRAITTWLTTMHRSGQRRV